MFSTKFIKKIIQVLKFKRLMYATNNAEILFINYCFELFFNMFFVENYASCSPIPKTDTYNL